MSYRITHFFSFLAIAICLSFPAFAQEAAKENTKEQDIRKLLTLTKAAEMGDQVIAQMTMSIQQSDPNVPPEFIERFRKEANSSELIEMIIPIYDRHLSHEDIRAIIVFYESPAGQRFIGAQDKIVAESMQAGERWGQEIVMRVLQQMQSAE